MADHKSSRYQYTPRAGQVGVQFDQFDYLNQGRRLWLTVFSCLMQNSDLWFVRHAPTAV